jgi:hypothetical protein
MEEKDQLFLWLLELLDWGYWGCGGCSLGTPGLAAAPQKIKVALQLGLEFPDGELGRLGLGRSPGIAYGLRDPQN